MEKVTIVLSDLHLGRTDELEDFVDVNENAFVRFLKRQSDDHKNRKIDLVILGDFLDIWQNATEQEKHAEHSKDVSIAVDPDLDLNRAKEIVAKHSPAFEGLRDFLESNADRCRIIITPGNHDHSLILGDIQEIVKRAIAGNSDSLRKKLILKTYYDEPELGIYAEHGNQFDGNNDYQDFHHFGTETAGYFFVRLFWNRLEVLRPNLDNWMNSFSAIFDQNLWELFYPAYHLFQQYYFDKRTFKRIKLASFPPVFLEGTSVGIPERNVSLLDFPDLLFTQRDVSGRIFSTDNWLEKKMIRLYHDSANSEFRSAVDKILREKYKRRIPKVPDGDPTMLELGFLERDPYVSAVRAMFAAGNGSAEYGPIKGGVLKPDIYKYILLGHTHKEKKTKLDALDVTYFNTGSWALRRDDNGNNASRLSYVVIHKSSGGNVEAALTRWQ